MKSGSNIYLGSGDLSLHMMDVCAESEMNLPLGFYEGISIAINLETLTEQTPEILKDSGIDGRQLCDKFCRQGKTISMPASTRIDYIFSVLYGLPEQICIPYFKLKVQELLLFLSMLELSEEKELDRYYSQQVETIKEIHEQLTRNVDKRFTIAEIADFVGYQNQSKFTQAFKDAFHVLPTMYRKQYR
ncbi:helix-turn-helix domain-containing protein [Clostridium sp. Marseille-P2415]|uniref:helix-turn-helix domain-containing protein n=1 Tax=Clostridium sp. Marseille-P2415 TaxID=1805471 RepID=UPI0009885431|nr:helix-turn-helix domain-containing protein [Clostridium sp. Marseille-P2415]